MEEEIFKEETVVDVEGCVRDFFLGCLKDHGSEEPEIVDGKLFGQEIDSIRERCKRQDELFIDPHFATNNIVAGK